MLSVDESESDGLNADNTGSGETGSENESEAEPLDSAYNNSFNSMNHYFRHSFLDSPKEELDNFTKLVKQASDTQKKFFDSGTLKAQYNLYLQKINFDLTDRSTDSMKLVEDDLINTQVKFYYKIQFLHDICRVKQKKIDDNYHYHGKYSDTQVKIKDQTNNLTKYLDGITDMHQAYEKFRKEPLNLVYLAEFTLAELTAATRQKYHISRIWIDGSSYENKDYFHCFETYMNNNLNESEIFLKTNREKIDNYNEDNNSPQTTQTDEFIIDDDITINKQIELYFKLMTLYSIYNIIYTDKGDLMSPVSFYRQKILKQKETQRQHESLEKNRLDLIGREEIEKQKKIRQLAKEIKSLQAIDDFNNGLTAFQVKKLFNLKEKYESLSGNKYYGGNSENARLTRKKATRKRNKSMYKQKKNSHKKLKIKKKTRKVNKTTYKQWKSATSCSAARIVRARI